jgi:hypothetical protein
MAKKDKVNIIRNTDFDEIDLALTEAMSELDSTNVRILELLESETCNEEENAAQLEIEGTREDSQSESPSPPEESANAS